MSLLPVEEALAPGARERRASPLAAEDVPLAAAHGRTLAADLAALRTQPPFAASAMDGYARARGRRRRACRRRCASIGTSAAGRGFRGRVGAGRGGAHLHRRADAGGRRRDRHPGGCRRATATPSSSARRRRAGPLRAPERPRFPRAATRSSPPGSASMRAASRSPPPWATRACRCAAGRASRSSPPATSSCRPGETAGPDQIVASNPYALAALVDARRRRGRSISASPATRFDGSRARHRGRARRAAPICSSRSAAPRSASTTSCSRRSRARAWSSASGASPAAGQAADARPARRACSLLGLPGNPVSSIVCGILFLVPAIRALLGDPDRRARPGRAGRPRRRSPRQRRPPGLPARDAGAVARRPARRDRSAGAGFLDARRSSPAPTRSSCAPPHAPAAQSGEPCRIIRLARSCSRAFAC